MANEYIKQWQAKRRAKLKEEGYKQVNFVADPELLVLIESLKGKLKMTTAEVVTEALNQLKGSV